MPKRVAVGIVATDKMNKTRRVEIGRFVRHPKYGKILRRKTVCHVHDEKNESHIGDTVEIVESRPRSHLKRWELVRILSKGNIVDIVAMRAAAKADAAAASSEAKAEAGKSEAAKPEAGK